jgi:5-methylcytosine-specific restriction endonuclease McrA
METDGTCALCGREEQLTRHHLVPRTRHHNKRNKREFSRAEVMETVGLCRPCHRQIHALFTEKELERTWNSIEKLRAEPRVQAFIAWIAEKPRGFLVPARR